MNYIRNLRLRVKLILLIVLAVLFMGFIGFQSIYYMNQMSHKSEQMYGDKLLPVKWLNEIKTNFYLLETKVLEMMSLNQTERNKELVESYNFVIEQNNDTMRQFESVPMNDQIKELYDDYKAQLEQYRKIRLGVMELAQAGKTTEAYGKYSAELVPAGNEIAGTLTSLIDLNDSDARSLNTQNVQGAKDVRNVILLSILAAIILLGISGTFINLLITRPIHALQDRMGKAAEGDLTSKGTYLYNDDVGTLTRYFNKMLDSLRFLIDQINENAMTLSASSQQLQASAEQSARSSEEVALSSQHLAEEFENQSSHVEKAGDAVSLISQGINEVEATGFQVGELAKTAVSNSRTGYESVVQINGQMNVIAEAVGESQVIIDRLGERAAEIGSILTVINDISTQTNLLSLNAAIEAARAGEMGRGFAVVADEVRKLAQQSTDSSGHIAELIRLTQSDIKLAILSMNNGSTQVKEGLVLTEETKGTFLEIENSVSSLSEKLEMMSASTIKLAEGSEHMVRLMDNVNHVSQSGMAISEQTAAASQAQQATTEEIEHSAKSLAQLAEELQNNLQKFKV